MSSAMDKALMEMLLEEKDESFEMPDLPEFLSCERNKLSLIGTVLNPSCQPMKHLIRNIPRKWQKEGRVTGVSLTSERFQFIFDSKHDLEDLLAKGVHTYNDWSIVVDRWYENPPDDYLRFMLVWVQIWNIPVNYYTEKAITKLGDLIGEVKEVIFNPVEPELQEFVRVKVLFDVSRPLRRSKVINFKNSDTATVRFHYERIQKRCYECQRLTHEKDLCPILIKERQDKASARRQGISIPKAPPPSVLQESDPLFGVLKESQVGCIDEMNKGAIAEAYFSDLFKSTDPSSFVDLNLSVKKDALFCCVKWAIESMSSHRQSKVLFAFEPGDLLSAFARPKAWPSFAFHVSELTHFLEKIGDWKVSEEKVGSNRGASLIAQSIVKGDRFQSYVAVGHLRWLHQLFEGERISS
ncbi:unnamed protein product [Arabidopsis thaliana]|uniref:(thale cress) hypothetical protein n=1 Tax=Arabidopsis thaliana TaxID=3702 RepID=A0A7G2ERT1_ARATH|nr:unnamed protein product [Arabidopsis thaliana]